MMIREWSMKNMAMGLIWRGGQKGAPREVSATGLDHSTVSVSLLLSLSSDSFGCSTSL